MEEKKKLLISWKMQEKKHDSSEFQLSRHIYALFALESRINPIICAYAHTHSHFWNETFKFMKFTLYDMRQCMLSIFIRVEDRSLMKNIVCATKITEWTSVHLSGGVRAHTKTYRASY